MAFKGESYIPLIIRVKPTEGDIWRVRDNGMLFGIPLKGGDFIEWTGAAWQLRPDLHYKLDDGSINGVQDEAIALEFEPLDEGAYVEGTKRMYNGLLYVRNYTEGDDTEWVAAHWTQTNVMSQLSTFILPLKQAADGTVSNNGLKLNVQGAAAWAEGTYTNALGDSSHAEGSGLVTTTVCSQDITNQTIIPVANATDIQPGMFANTIKITSVDTANSTLTLETPVTYAQYTSITITGGAVGLAAHSEGMGTLATDAMAHAEGMFTIAGQMAHAEGHATKALGLGSHAEGDNTTSGGQYAHTEGRRTQANADASHAGGIDMTVCGDAGFAHGQQATDTTIATVVAATINANDTVTLTLNNIETAWVTRQIGWAIFNNEYCVQARHDLLEADPFKIIVDSIYDFPDGFTEASFIGMQVRFPIAGAFNANAIALGVNPSAVGPGSMALGTNSVAIAENATALAGGIADAQDSVSIGKGANSKSPSAITIGEGTRTATPNGMALGKYNNDQASPFVVGWGTENERADCLKVDNNGHLWFINTNGILTDLTQLLASHNIV